MSQTTSLKAAIEVEFLERAATVLRLLAHPQRLRIVEYLEQHGSAPVHDLMDYLSLPQAVTSQHLTVMKRAGIVQAVRRGREVWYTLADPRCASILHCIRNNQEQAP
jgi:DNA-binding transcriptional ArsR family regulator